MTWHLGLALRFRSPNNYHVVAAKLVSLEERFVVYVHVEDILSKAKQNASVHVIRSTGSSLAKNKDSNCQAVKY